MLAFEANTFVHAEDAGGKAPAADSLHANMVLVDSAVTETRMQHIKKKVKHAGNVFYRFVKNFDNYDTTYISPNYYNFTAMLQNTNSFQTYKFQGRNEDGLRQSISTQPAPSVKVGPYFGWRWIFLGYTFDVAHPKAISKSTEFNFSLYSAMLGCDFIYIKNTGNFRLRRTTGFEGVGNKDFYNVDFRGLKDRKSVV